MPVTYAYQVCDLWTDDHIEWLPLESVRYGRRICAAGDFSARLPVTSRAMAVRVQHMFPTQEDDITRGPGRTLIHVWRGGEIWGSYIVWRGKATGDRRGRITVQLGGRHMESWVFRRHIRGDDSTAEGRPPLEFVQVDQLDIARGIVDNIQTQGPAGGWQSLSLELGGPASSGILRDRTYGPWDMGATAGERLEQLSQVIDGPEWMIRTWWDGSARRRQFYTANRIGDADMEHVFAQPGNILDWGHEVDASETGTIYWARGEVVDQDTGERLVHGANDTSYNVTGWARLEEVREYPTVSELDTLSDHAEWWMARRGGAQHSLSVTVRLDEHSTLTPDRLGDTARLIMVNDWWPPDPATGAPTLDQRRRVIGMDIVPVSRDQGQEEARLIFEEERAPGDEDEPLGEPTYERDVVREFSRNGWRDTLKNQAPS